MIQEPYVTRLLKFRELLQEQALDAFLVAVPENRHYLSGYEAEDLQPAESSGYLLITDSEQYLLTDPRYEEAAAQEAPGFEIVVYTQGVAQVLPDLFSSLRIRKLGSEGDHLPFSKFREIEHLLETANPGAQMTASEGLAERLRVIKTPDEIEKIRTSLKLTEDVLAGIWETLAPGRTEKDLAWEIERKIREGGGQGVSFPPIVASGPNAALPHAVPTNRVIAAGEPVIFDMGSKLGYYCSDMTRTWIGGTPQPKIQEIYRIVREAQLAAQNVLKAGMDSVEVDAAARDLIGRAGYGDRFGHGLGHGVGLAVHEKPGLRKQGGTILEENMVVTIEPGIYLPGVGGVRLENMVRVTRTGCEILNSRHLFYEW